MKGKCIKLPKPRRLKEIDKTDDSKYYAYHRMIGLTTKNCYILKYHIQILVNEDILKI